LVKIKKLKDKVWRVFSRYIRLKYSDWDGYCVCVTCDKSHPYKEMNSGHYIHNRNSCYFDERNVHPQCVYCNQYLSGNRGRYATYIIDKYGREVLDELHKLEHSEKKFTVGELEELAKEYKQKLKEII